MVDKMAQAFVPIFFTFKKRNAPTIRVVVGVAATLGETAKTEGHIGRGVAVHAQQLAHVKNPQLNRAARTRACRLLPSFRA